MEFGIFFDLSISVTLSLSKGDSGKWHSLSSKLNTPLSSFDTLTMTAARTGRQLDGKRLSPFWCLMDLDPIAIVFEFWIRWLSDLFNK